MKEQVRKWKYAFMLGRLSARLNIFVRFGQAKTSCILYLVGSNCRIPDPFFSSINPLFPRTKERRQNEQCTGEVLGEQLLEFRDENESDSSLQEAPEILFTPSGIDAVHAVY
ncbi:uncharacterized protein LOC144631729 [Oculina patagonica]